MQEESKNFVQGRTRPLWVRMRRLLNRRILFAILCVAAVYVLIGCPFKYFTGISCPGCGMTRACVAAVTLDFRAAWHWHPLVFVLPLVFVAAFVCRGALARLRVRQGLLLALVTLFMGVYFYRIFFGDKTVVSVQIPPVLLDIKNLWELWRK